MVEEVAGGEGVEGVLVDPAALGLPVGHMPATRVRALVPVEAEPAEVVELARLGPRHDPRAVDVLDPQDESTAGGPRRQPAEEGRRRGAEVEIARRRGPEG